MITFEGQLDAVNLANKFINAYQNFSSKNIVIDTSSSSMKIYGHYLINKVVTPNCSLIYDSNKTEQCSEQIIAPAGDYEVNIEVNDLSLTSDDHDHLFELLPEDWSNYSEHPLYVTKESILDNYINQVEIDNAITISSTGNSSMMLTHTIFFLAILMSMITLFLDFKDKLFWKKKFLN